MNNAMLVGVTSDVKFAEKLEKRVKSRLSSEYIILRNFYFFLVNQLINDFIFFFFKRTIRCYYMFSYDLKSLKEIICKRISTSDICQIANEKVVLKINTCYYLIIYIINEFIFQK